MASALSSPGGRARLRRRKKLIAALVLTSICSLFLHILGMVANSAVARDAANLAIQYEGARPRGRRVYYTKTNLLPTNQTHWANLMNQRDPAAFEFFLGLPPDRFDELLHRFTVEYGRITGLHFMCIPSCYSHIYVHTRPSYWIGCERSPRCAPACAQPGGQNPKRPCLTSSTRTAAPRCAPACAQPGCWPARRPCRTSSTRTAAPRCAPEIGRASGWDSV